MPQISFGRIYNYFPVCVIVSDVETQPTLDTVCFCSPRTFVCVGATQLGCVHANVCVLYVWVGWRGDECAAGKVKKLIWFKVESDPFLSDTPHPTTKCSHMESWKDYLRFKEFLILSHIFKIMTIITTIMIGDSQYDEHSSTKLLQHLTWTWHWFGSCSSMASLNIYLNITEMLYCLQTHFMI